MKKELTFCEYGPADFLRIRDFAVASFAAFAPPTNWLLDRWEVVATLGRILNGLDEEAWGRQIGLWQDAQGHLVALAHGEEGKGSGFIEVVHPQIWPLCPLNAIMDFLEERVAVTRDEGQSCRLLIPAGLSRLERLAAARGYVRREGGECLSAVALTPRDVSELPPGFIFADGTTLHSEEKAAAHAAAFGYAAQPALVERAVQGFALLPRMPDYRRDLDVAVRAPGGEIAAFAGVWLDAANAICILEPVGTRPQAQRHSLAAAAIGEGTRRAAALGARRAFVGSEAAFYRHLGFRVQGRLTAWDRRW